MLTFTNDIGDVHYDETQPDPLLRVDGDSDMVVELNEVLFSGTAFIEAPGFAVELDDADPTGSAVAAALSLGYQLKDGTPAAHEAWAALTEPEVLVDEDGDPEIVVVLDDEDDYVPPTYGYRDGFVY